jgi:tRNA(Met) C34 N-acetyltransferase TmcA
MTKRSGVLVVTLLILVAVLVYGFWPRHGFYPVELAIYIHGSTSEYSVINQELIDRQRTLDIGLDERFQGSALDNNLMVNADRHELRLLYGRDGRELNRVDFDFAGSEAEGKVLRVEIDTDRIVSVAWESR